MKQCHRVEIIKILQQRDQWEETHENKGLVY